jgi:hypothetical protein
MKKIILSLAIATVMLSSFTTYAADKMPGAVVKQALTREFSQAKDVEWTTVSKEGVYQAKFIYNNESIQAFFTDAGEFLGTTRQIAKNQLPILIVSALEKQYADYRVATVFEYSKTDGLAYYITIVKPEGGMVLKATGNGDLGVFKKNVR